MSNIIFTHCEDPDGIIAHALLIRALGINDVNTFNHFFVRYDRLVDDFGRLEDRLRELPQSNVYIADIGLNGQLANAGGAPYARLENIAGLVKQWYWFDHHETTLEHREALRRMSVRLVYNPERCAALLVRDAFGLTGEYESGLAQIAQAHDYKKPGSMSQRVLRGNEIEKVIALANEQLDCKTLLHLSSELAQGAAVDQNFQLHGKWRGHVTDFDTRTVAAYRELEESVVVEDVVGLRVLFAHSPAILSQKPALDYIQTHYAEEGDVYVCFFRPPVHNHIISRKQGHNFPVVELCVSLGGGGRGNGGGFSTTNDISATNLSLFQEIIRKKIAKFYSK